MKRRGPMPGEFALTEEDLAPDVEREIVTSSGEIISLHPWVAQFRHNALAEREERRLAYCEREGYDPATFRGCVDCGGTGYGFRKLPCHCSQGRSVMRFQAKIDDQITDELLTNLRDPKWIRQEPKKRGEF
jgi:hypothetical protein